MAHAGQLSLITADSLEAWRLADIFISYSSRDRSKADELAKHIALQGYSVWWDRADLQAGDAWRARIDKEIQSASTLVALWSTSAAQSEWVRDEIKRAQDQGIRVLPVLLDNTLPAPEMKNVQQLRYDLAEIVREVRTGPLSSIAEASALASVQLARPEFVGNIKRNRINMAIQLYLDKQATAGGSHHAKLYAKLRSLLPKEDELRTLQTGRYLNQDNVQRLRHLRSRAEAQD